MKYRKKPVVIDAHRWNPNESPTNLPAWLWDILGLNPERLDQATGALTIKTLEGDMKAMPGDWIIRGIKGEVYPCKPDIFEASYEPAALTERGEEK